MHIMLSPCQAVAPKQQDKLLLVFNILCNGSVWFRDLKGLLSRSTTCSLLVGSNCLLAIVPCDEASMSLNGNEKGEESRCNDGATHEVKSLQSFHLTEAKSKPHSSKIATSTHNSSNGSSNGRVNIRHNPIGGPLGRLDNGGEKDHDYNGDRKRVGVGKDEHECTLNNEKSSLPDETTPHSHSGVEVIRYVSTHAASEEVHPAEDRGNGGGTLGCELKLALKVGCSSIVHRELDSEATGVLDEEDPGVDVRCAAAEGCCSRDLWHGAILFHVLVVSLGSIIRNLNNKKSKAESHNGRDDAHGSPGLFG
mmetsp:Transcript_14270/g.25460  ORF Transcript_14270/g.25460 Transcript_14270/m.25460 type:complete len:308 (+) Transcript_14270:250-1173(+)